MSLVVTQHLSVLYARLVDFGDVRWVDVRVLLLVYLVAAIDRHINALVDQHVHLFVVLRLSQVLVGVFLLVCQEVVGAILRAPACRVELLQILASLVLCVVAAASVRRGVG